MSEMEAASLLDQAILLELITPAQARAAIDDAEDGSLEALERTLLRKQFLTSWQIDKLKKGELHGFFYGGCKVLFHIAEGTFARVYRGRKMPGNQSVAIKVLRQRFTSDASSVDRFNKEAEAGLRLVHPNIVRIYDYGEQDRRNFMVMEYVEGSNLRDFLKYRHRLSGEHALPIMIGLAEALKYSLDQGITHRDIKATNVLISSSGVAKLVDFGLATIGVSEGKLAAAHGMRTVDYSALERTCGSPKGDPRSDIYFLGCVFYQMLTGNPPMPEVEASDPLAKMLKRSFGAIRPISEHPHAPPPPVCEIVEKMMKVDLRTRYQTMQEVLDDLRAYQKKLQAQAAKAAAPTAGGRDPIPGAFGSDLFGDQADRKNVLCVEAQDEIQDIFRRTLSKMGYRVLLVSDAERAAERYREQPPDVVIFDLDGFGPDSLDAFLDMHEKAHEDGHELAALVLLGPRQRDLIDKLPADDRLVVLSKPIKMKDVQDALSMLVPVG